MTQLVFDMETDGLLDTVTTIHCIVTYDLDTHEYIRYIGDMIPKGISSLQVADLIIGHDIIAYDLRVIKKLYHIDINHNVYDTSIASRVGLSLTKLKDRKLKLPHRLEGSHSLEAWGHRLGCRKGTKPTDFLKFSEELVQYCQQGICTIISLYFELVRQQLCPHLIKLEQDVSLAVASIRDCGFYFDMDRAIKLKAELEDSLAIYDTNIKKLFGNWVDEKGRETIFNPNSRDHIARKLRELYDWKPTVFTPTGKPKVDEDILNDLEYEGCRDLSCRFTIQKRLTQLDNSWLSRVKLIDCGIYTLPSEINTCGTITGRATHARPNVAQVPAKQSLYGKECRQLFTACGEKHKLVGVDLSGLELRCLAHYLYPYDDGEYARAVVEGDVHTLNQKAIGLETRDQAKTFIYAFIYGAGDAKLGSIIGSDASEGKRLRETFLENLPQLRKLKDAVQTQAERGIIKGLDGRKLFVRSQHSVLNLLIQSAGAIITKVWLQCINRTLTDFRLVAWIHDEIQLHTHINRAHQLGKDTVATLRKVEKALGLKCPLDAEYKIGNNWSETH